MKVTILLTADHASIDQATGKLNVLGAFTRISSRQFPVRHPRLSLVFQLRPDLGDHSSQRSLRVVLLDADGQELMQMTGAFNFAHTKDGTRPEFNALLELNNLEFPHPGNYDFCIYVDDEPQGTTSIELVEVKQGPRL